jgi:hypothetical protein
VRIVFEGVMVKTEVFVNGQSAGPAHEGSFYEFKYDITPLLKFGATNLLEVTVGKVADDPSVMRAERQGDFWNFGGIFRPVLSGGAAGQGTLTGRALTRRPTAISRRICILGRASSRKRRR